MLSVMNIHGKSMAMHEQPNSYISNMMLPDKVKATRLNPLGPDCIIKTGSPDQSTLNAVHYYWYTTREKGCVESVVKHHGGQDATASDFKCVITRKERRFEAYCCMLCRSNFVTIAQALLHLKAIHRPNCKIFIQDKDIFHNIDEAMEVPAVPLPWHVTKKAVDQEPSKEVAMPDGTPRFVIPPGALTQLNDTSNDKPPDNIIPPPSKLQSHSDDASMRTPSPSHEQVKQNVGDNSPVQDAMSKPGEILMVSIISAITGEFKTQVKNLTFNEEYSSVTAAFVDDTSVVANTPDLTKTSSSVTRLHSEIEADEPLSFFVEEGGSLTEQDGVKKGQITLRTNRPAYAIKLLVDSVADAANHVDKPQEAVTSEPVISTFKPIQDIIPNNPSNKSALKESSELLGMKLAARPMKTVRFMLGAPDSSDDERADTPERTDHSSRNDDGKGRNEKHLVATPTKEADSGMSKDLEEEGLRNVVDDLMSTASKGRIFPIPPTSPQAISSSLNPIPRSSIPQVGSSPALSEMVDSSKSKTNSLSRVHSWTPSLGASALSVASIRRPYTARGFTYAEKIELMKQQNDYDASFVTKHIIKAPTGPTNDGNKTSESASNKDNQGSVQDKNKRYNTRESPNRRRYSDNEIQSDSEDDSPPTMLNNVNAFTAAAYATLIQGRLMNPSIFPSEYYGSGEWANAAMETLKSLQSSNQTSTRTFPRRSASHGNFGSHDAVVKNETSDEAFEVGSKRLSLDNQTRESLSDDNTSSDKQLKVKFPSSRKRIKSSNEVPSIDTDPMQAVKRKKTKKHDSIAEKDAAFSFGLRTTSTTTERPFVIPPFKYVQSENKDDVRHISSPTGVAGGHSAIVPLSPLLSDEEKSYVHVHNSSARQSRTDATTVIVPSHSRAKTAESSSKNPVISRFASASMGAKCSSDPALSSSSTTAKSEPSSSEHAAMASSRILEANTPSADARTSESAMDKQDAVLAAGDNLQLTGNVTVDDFDERQIITTRLKRSKQASSSNGDKTMMNMPEIFRNCIETCVKIQCIQKVHVCKVCGYSVDVTNQENSADDDLMADKVLQTHVMEHSLKELYATGYEMPNL